MHLEKKCLQRPPSMLCKIWGILKKIVCTAGVEGENLQVLNRWWRKLSFLLEIMIPPGKIMVRPLLQIPYSSDFDEILYDGCST